MMPTLKKGISSLNVRIAKYLMVYNAPGKASSTFDDKFRKHVEKWQTQNGLTCDGVIGPKTWEKLASIAALPSTSNKAATYALQYALGISATGKFSTVTQNTLKTFQKAAGLKDDGICGPKTWKELIAQNVITHKHTVNYKQNDPKWGGLTYSKSNNKKQTYANSGCAPTSAASVITSLCNKTVLPTVLGKQAIDWGYRRASGGTDGKFLHQVAQYYGLRMVETKNLKIFKHCIDAGGYVICAFKAGSWWTNTGHYSPAWSYDNAYYYVDNTISTIKIKRKISSLSSDCRAFYCFYP